MRRYSYLVAIGAVMLGSTAFGDSRPWTFTYDTYPLGKGGVEYEQWVTWKHDKKSEHGFDRVEFRHEIEIGISDNFDLSFYVANWKMENSAEFTGTRFEGFAVEAVYYILNPLKDDLGLALYAEVAGGDREIEFEQKVLVQKNFGNWSVAYNLILETEIEREDGESEVEGKLAHAIGVTYSTGHWQLGAEMTIESEFAHWSHYAGTTVYAGPAIAYQSDRWWAGVTPMFQLTNRDEPDFVLRFMAGYMLK